MRKVEDSERSLSQLLEGLGIDQQHTEVLDPRVKEVLDSNKATTAKLNILLSGENSGIELANRLADELNIPFVLINSNGSNHFTAEASITIPENYLNSSNQEILNTLSKYLSSQGGLKTGITADLKKDRPNHVENAIFIKDNFNYVKISFDDIDFTKSDGNYIEIHWKNRVSVLKKTMKSFEKKAFRQSFFQVHRSYLINLNKITRIGSAHVYLDKYKIPLSKGKKEQLIEMLDTF